MGQFLSLGRLCLLFCSFSWFTVCRVPCSVDVSGSPHRPCSLVKLCAAGFGSVPETDLSLC